MKLKDALVKNFDLISSYIKSLTDVSPTKDNIEKLYLDYLNKNIRSIILSLSQKEAFLFYHAYKKEGVSLSSISKETKKEQESSLQKLLEKGLLTYRANISQVYLSYKLFIFEEVRELIDKKNLFKTQENFFNQLLTYKESSLKYYIPDVPYDVFQFFYSYGMVTPKEFYIQQFGEQSFKYLKESGYITSCIFVKEEVDPETQDISTTFCNCIELIAEPKLMEQLQIHSTVNYHTTVFNQFMKICYLIHRDGVGFTKKNEINKKNLERFTKDIESEQVLSFFINFLHSKNYLEKILKEEEIYKLNEQQIFTLLHSQLKVSYKSIVQSDPLLKSVVDLIFTLSYKELSVADIILAYLKSNPKMMVHNIFLRNIRRQVISVLEMLHYIGFLVRSYTKEGVVFYTISPLAYHFYKDDTSFNHESQKGALKVSSSLEVIVNLDKVDYQSSYTLNMFMDIMSFSTVVSYKLSRLSCARALYLGFKIEDLIEVLEKYSDDLNKDIIQNIYHLANNYKEGELSHAIVLKTKAGVIDQLMLQPEYRSYIVERISDEYAIVSDELKIKRILEEDFIFFKMKSK